MSNVDELFGELTVQACYEIVKESFLLCNYVNSNPVKDWASKDKQMPNTAIKVGIQEDNRMRITQNKINLSKSQQTRRWLGLPVIEIIISNKERYATSICDSSQYQ